MLSPEHIAFFKDIGYLLVPGAMDVQLCAQARDLMWAALPDGVALDRHPAASHVGSFRAADVSADSLHTRDGNRWLLRSAGTSKAILKLIYSDPICAMASQLLGDQLRQPVVNGTPMGSRGPAWPGGPTDPALDNEGARGIYFTLPEADKTPQPDRCHTDGHPFQLGVVGLLSRVPAGGGGFKVWPRSHRCLYPTRDTAPVECWGETGDIVFWHHRTAHMAGHNLSEVIRQAVLADFWTTELDRQCMDPPQSDMWRDWSDEVRGTAASAYSAEFARQQRLIV